MKQQGTSTFRRKASRVAALAVCLFPALSFANDPVNVGPFDSNQSADNGQPLVKWPLQSDPGLSFDLGGSEKRKLELRLAEPLTLDFNNLTRKSASGVGSVFLDSSLNLRLNDNLDFTTSLGAGRSEASFQPLGSIHCQNGVLEQGSYRASDCHFINQANILKQDQVALGLRYGKNNFSSAFSMFRNEASTGQQGVLNYGTTVTSPVLGGGLLMPGFADPLTARTGFSQPLNYLSGETSGLDMEFQVGFTMDSAGDIQLGLQLTRVLDASYEATSAYSPNLQNWTIANPFDSARINFDWSKGNFSGGIQGFYREQVQFLDRGDLDSSTSFDVHFTWRAPWNANLSVGTSNILGAGSEDKGKTDSGLQDPFEAVYGRIPYVRYQQDL